MSGMTSLAGENTASANGFPMAIKATNGAAHGQTVSDYRGLYPNTLYAEQSGTGAGADNDLVFTTADISAYDTHILTLTVGTADVEVSINGTTFTDSATSPIFLKELTAEGAAGLYDLVNVMAVGKIYMLEAKVKKLRVRSASAAATACHMASYAS